MNSYVNPQKFDHKELLLEKPIKIQKRKIKENPKKDSDDEGPEDVRKYGLAPTKKIKNEVIKEKILELKNKRKGYDLSENSSDSSFDEKNYPILLNK